MKKIFVVVLAVAIALVGATAAMAGITNTKHNLTSTGTGTVKALAGEQGNEICIWCHTPHGADVAFTGAPLWNKAAPTTGSFTMYGATVSGVAGTTIAGNPTAAQPNASSLACLSCHDGASAINSIVNASGSGGYTSGGALVTFGGSAAATRMPAGNISNIGVNLTNDHPISIAYVTGAAGLRATSFTLTGWLGATTVNNLLRNGSVECGSCHEPHTDAAGNAPFLRVSNAGSALCLGCHDK
jgi:predicted CXXCH cytochrome family protein